MGAQTVSVVVPVYNHAAYVADALASIAAQTRPPDEVIIVDDKSRDGSAERVRHTVACPQFQSLRSRVSFTVNSRNLGAHVTINQAVDRCRSDWVTILNSDDMFHPLRLESLLEAAEVDSSWLFSGVKWIDGFGRELHRRARTEWYGVVERAKLAPSITWSFLERQITVSTGNLMFRKELWERLGGFCDLQYCHDWDFVLRASLRSEPIFLPQPLYFYRDHSLNSFKSLGDVAERESRIVARRFVEDANGVGFGGNPSAPSPVLWPHLVDAIGLRSGFFHEVT